jgi:hypothetical protein
MDETALTILGLVSLLVGYFVVALGSRVVGWLKTPIGMTLGIMGVFALTFWGLMSLFGGA